MPARTNEFQKLVSLITKSLTSAGDTVEDSAMVKVEGLEGEREIDILWTTSTGLVKVKVAVETKDEGRKLDLVKFDSISAKYNGAGGIPVHKIVVVTRAGFTPDVERKAKLQGVSLLTLDLAQEQDWSTLAPEHSFLRGMKKVNLEMQPHFHEIDTLPELPRDLATQIIKYGRYKCGTCTENNDHGTFLQHMYASTLHRSDSVGVTFRQDLQKGLIDHKGVIWVSLSWKEKDGARIIYQGVDYPIREVRARMHAAKAQSPIDCDTYLMKESDGDSRIVHHFSAEMGQMKMQIVVPDGLKSERVAFKIEKLNPKQKAKRRKQQKKAKKK